MNSENVANHIINWLKDYANNAGVKGFVVGVSGGIDSAVTSTLCAKTGLPLVCVEMPIHQDPSQVSRAEEHIKNLKSKFDNVSSVKTDLTESFEVFQKAMPKTEDGALKDLTLANTRARLRMTSLYYIAGINASLVAGTGNKHLIRTLQTLLNPQSDLRLLLHHHILYKIQHQNLLPYFQFLQLTARLQIY